MDKDFHFKVGQKIMFYPTEEYEGNIPRVGEIVVVVQVCDLRIKRPDIGFSYVIANYENDIDGQRTSFKHCDFLPYMEVIK